MSGDHNQYQKPFSYGQLMSTPTGNHSMRPQSTSFNAYWLEPGAVVPVNIETTATLINEIQRLRQALGHHVDNVYISEERVHKTEKSIHEPVAWMKPSGLVSPYKHGSYQIPLYAAPPKPEYATEVVAVSENGIRTVKQTLIQKREWASLTGYQRLKFADRFHISGEAIEAIEQALKEKNCG